VRFKVCPNAWVDFSSGYEFDRYYFEGQRYTDSNHNRVSVGDGPFVALQFQTRW
jgi:hypothetical protein